jgi:preprotein translocase subunit SecA
MGQRDPLSEFKLESFTLFSDLLSDLRKDVVRYVMRVQVETAPPELQTPEIATPAGANNEPLGGVSQEDWGKVPRNAPCPCGSGKKFKHCHGAV